MNKNDRAHPSKTVYKNLPPEVKEKYTYRRNLRFASTQKPTTKTFKRSLTRSRGKAARVSRQRNRSSA